MKIYQVITAILFACILLICIISFRPDHEESIANQYPDKEYLVFPRQLSPSTPYDVDIALEQRLLKENKIDEAHRLFDILSWQMFISLNWPENSADKPQPAINDHGEPAWAKWKESYEVFREDGSSPLSWDSVNLPKRFMGRLPKNAKVLFRMSKTTAFFHHKRHTEKANEIDQAFTSPIWDQSGNIVRYEIRLNKPDFDYIVSNDLFNLNGQAAFSQAGKKVEFPAASRTKMGVVEIKLAWKILEPGKDHAERYYSTEAYVLNEDGSFSIKKVGLVGMHIASRTQSSPQWIWATFEQVDNLETDPLKEVDGRPIKPSFYDPACPTCPVNLIPDTNQKIIKNQIQRVLPILPATQELNTEVSKLLADKGSFMQYYQLIGTQWPTDPSSPPYTGSLSAPDALPQAVVNKSGGKPFPAYLTNMIMETYFQGGTSIADSLTAYNLYLGNEPAYFQVQGAIRTPLTKNTMIFGTESCMGCHYSSSIATSIDAKGNAVFGNPGTAGFEWLLQLKAHVKTK